MSVVILLIGISIVFAGGFLVAFLWAVRSGQYDDSVTPAMRMLFNDGVVKGKPGTAHETQIAQKED